MSIASITAKSIALVLGDTGLRLPLSSTDAGGVRSTAYLIDAILAPRVEYVADVAVIGQTVADTVGSFAPNVDPADLTSSLYDAAAACVVATPVFASPARNKAGALGRMLAQCCEAVFLGQAFAAEARRQFGDRQSAIAARKRIADAMDGSLDRIAAATGQTIVDLLGQTARIASDHIASVAANLQPIVQVTTPRSAPSSAVAFAPLRRPKPRRGARAPQQRGHTAVHAGHDRGSVTDGKLMWAGFEYVTLAVDGFVLMGWQEVSITRSMQAGAISFTLEATNPSWSPQAMALRRGKQIEIRSALEADTALSGGGDLLCAGAIDTYDADIGEKTKTIRIEGRSKGRSAIDCPPVNHKTGKVKDKTLLDAAKEFDEFGIGFTTDQQLENIPLIQRRPGETMFDTIERYARRDGQMLAAQPNGQIAITRAGSKRHAGVLVEGQSPLRKVRIHLAPHAKRSPTVVRGQRRLGTGKDNLRQEYRDDSGGDGEHRPQLVIAEGDHTLKDLKKRAEWERLRRAGYQLQVNPCVSRWRDQDGAIWDPGRLMAISIPSEDVNQDLTLSTVTFHQKIGENEGTKADLSFVDPKSHGGKKSMGKSDEAFDPGDAIE